MTAYFPDYKDIEKAEKVVREIIPGTPCWHSSQLSDRYHCTVYTKREDRQKVRSFKIRGAYNKISSLSDDEARRGVVCASAGNHAQGVAYSCARFGIKGHVFMPVSTPGQKVSSVKYYGGENIEVTLAGKTFDECEYAAVDFAVRNGMTFIHPFNDPKVIEGQGSVAVEMMETMKEENVTFDYVFVPIGGGGLASGVGAYVKAVSPSTKIIGVEPSGAASMQAAMKAGHPVRLKEMDTFVDGAAVREVGELTYGICSKVLDGIVIVPEGAVCSTILKAYNHKGLVLEPAGALSMTALRFFQKSIAGHNVCCILSGSNNDSIRMEEIQRRSDEFEKFSRFFSSDSPVF